MEKLHCNSRCGEKEEVPQRGGVENYISTAEGVRKRKCCKEEVWKNYIATAEVVRKRKCHKEEVWKITLQQQKERERGSATRRRNGKFHCNKQKE